MEKLISVGADRMRFFEEQRDASLMLLRKVIAEGKQLEIARQRLLTLLLNENVAKHYKEGMREALLSGEVETAVKLIRQVELSLSQQAESEADCRDRLDHGLENLHTCAGEKRCANAIHVHMAVVPAGEPADQGIVTGVSARVSENTQDAKIAVPTQASDVDVIAESQSDRNKTSPPSVSATEISLADTLAGQAVLCESGDDLVRKEESEEFLQHATTLEQIKMGFAPSQVPTLTPFNTPCKEAEAPRIGVGKGPPVKHGTSPHSSPSVTEGARRLLEEARLEFGKITPPSPILQSEPCTVTAEVQSSVDLYRVSHGGGQKDVTTEQGEANERRTKRSLEWDEGGIPQNQQQTDVLVVCGPQPRLSRAAKPHSPTASESSNVHSPVQQSVVKVPTAGSNGSANSKERSQLFDTVRFTDRGCDVDTARFSSSHDRYCFRQTLLML